ncbi:MAG TPA: hypothetical protein DCG75_14340 [Bacteroidales bacterium]|nr:hypothetical protein [Bacteroidales bacterium]
MLVIKFTNSIFSSNTYLIYREEEKDVWLIDPGDSSQIFKWLKINDKIIKGILLTHYHIDHIYGVNDFYEEYPGLKIYASEQSLVGLFSEKLNGSYYMEMPYVLTCKKIQIVDANSEINLFENNIKALVLYTPGHNNDCISFEIGKYLFTGDALIPGVKIHTKSKLGDKLLALESIDRIVNQYARDTIICPGHGYICLLGDLVIDK